MRGYILLNLALSAINFYLYYTTGSILNGLIGLICLAGAFC
jgi:hypothetical protein